MKTTTTKKIQNNIAKHTHTHAKIKTKIKTKPKYLVSSRIVFSQEWAFQNLHSAYACQLIYDRCRLHPFHTPPYDRSDIFQGRLAAMIALRTFKRQVTKNLNITLAVLKIQENWLSILRMNRLPVPLKMSSEFVYRYNWTSVLYTLV